MKFVIRDDDLNYFSQPSDVERWYRDIFAQGIPAGFSTIPFINPKKDAYEIHRPFQDKEYPVSDNAELTTYAKNNPLIEIMQHGVTHVSKDGYEYARTSGLVGETQRGKGELYKAFGERFKAIFVPPHDWIGSHGVAAIEAADMDIIRGRGAGLRNWLWRWQYAAVFMRMLVFRIVRFVHGDRFAYPHVLDFGKHKEACSYRLEDEDLFDGLAYAKEKDGVFVVVTHLHFYTDEKKQRLTKLIERARGYGASFVPPSELFS